MISKSPLALLFPGQGSQYVGMSKNYHGQQQGQEFLSKADKILNYPLSQLMLEGPEDQLKLTQYTQPAILTHSTILLHQVETLLHKYEKKVDFVLGHSVGEFAALVAAKTLLFEDAVNLVHLRGKYMQQAVPVGQGKMFAVLKVPEEIVIQACRENSNSDFQVMPANFNEPEQIVISGHSEACLAAVKWLEENYKERFRAVELPVSAPFHSTLMKPAAEQLAAQIEKTSFQANQIAYVANIDAEIYKQQTDPAVIARNLVKQVDGSVLWTQSIKKLPENTLCLEVGPGKVLKGLVKKIRPELKVLDLDSSNSWSELEELLK